MPPVPSWQVERAARMYPSNVEAAAALGVSAGAFGRMCRRYGIPTPHQRRRQQRQWRHVTTSEDLHATDTAGR